MQDGRGGSGITAAALKPVPDGTGLKSLLKACGKFCAEVAFRANKCLFFKSFFGFEPQCSNRVKPVPLNDLAWFCQNSKGFCKGWLFSAEFDTISTVPRVGGEPR
jgi:hypothetical protein